MFPLFVIVGPTAVGKTDLALALAKEMGGEIISADSMQIYEWMDIGTAKPTPQELAYVPHHLVDCIPPDQEFTVADFQKEVDHLIPAIYRRGNLPMLVGGTGLYVQAVTEGFVFPEMDTDWEFRQEMQELAEREGNQAVHGLLAEIDPPLAQKLHPNDLRRVIRGIEVYRQTNKTSTYFQKKAEEAPPRYDTLKIGLNREREDLYERINLRVEKMIAAGLEEEVTKLLQMDFAPDLISMQGLGYKEMVGYLQGEYDLERAIYLIQRNTRHFAKRQLTWFKRDLEIHWFNPGELHTNELVNNAKRLIEERWGVLESE